MADILTLVQSIIQLMILYRAYKARRAEKYSPPHRLLNIIYNYRWTRTRQDVWRNLEQNVHDFWFMTGEIPESLEALIRRLTPELNQAIRPRGVCGRRALNTRNRVLMGMIWMCQYPRMHLLTFMFGVDVSVVCRVVHDVVPILHQYLVPRFIRWPTNAQWLQQRNEIEGFPSAVGFIDATPFRISRPVGRIQRLYYRGDKKFHFLNWLLIVDTHGFFVFSQPGFAGHLHDSTCYG